MSSDSAVGLAGEKLKIPASVRCLAPELRGHASRVAYTKASGVIGWTLDDYAHDVSDFLGAVGVGPNEKIDILAPLNNNDEQDLQTFLATSRACIDNVERDFTRWARALELRGIAAQTSDQLHPTDALLVQVQLDSEVNYASWLCDAFNQQIQGLRLSYPSKQLQASLLNDATPNTE